MHTNVCTWANSRLTKDPNTAGQRGRSTKEHVVCVWKSSIMSRSPSCQSGGTVASFLGSFRHKHLKLDVQVKSSEKVHKSMHIVVSSRRHQVKRVFRSIRWSDLKRIFRGVLAIALHIIRNL